MSLSYQDLGWSNFFQQQRAAGCSLIPCRIAAVHRSTLTGLGPDGEVPLLPDRSTGDYAAGDWVLATDSHEAVQRLERRSELCRPSAGAGTEVQLIAANVDSLIIVSSCNADFNPARLERYLALAHQSGCYPVIALTKADQCADADSYRRKAEALAPNLTVLTLNARNPDAARQILDWVPRGQTAVLAGSSGVGKTTLSNLLTGSSAGTQAIREDDAKGRHTTTARRLRRMVNGGWLIDTPGMRSLPLAAAGEGIAEVFADLEELSRQCRFSDCRHDGEPGCAVAGAAQSGDLDPARVKRWQKLRREDRINSETLAQSRSRDKAFGKMIRSVKRVQKGRKGY